MGSSLVMRLLTLPSAFSPLLHAVFHEVLTLLFLFEKKFIHLQNQSLTRFPSAETNIETIHPLPCPAPSCPATRPELHKTPEYVSA
jgi:hypothetical protein